MNKRGPKVKVYTPEIELYFKLMGKTLRNIRLANGYSNHETYSYEIGIARAQYLSYEHGRNIQLHTLLKILTAINVTPSDFFARVDNAYTASTPDIAPVVE
jgi:transcriptional regulator with XRE-family HTH domain